MSKINYVLYLSFFLFSGISLSHILDFVDFDYPLFGSVSLKFMYWFLFLVLIFILSLLTHSSTKKIAPLKVIVESKIKIFFFFILYSVLGVAISSYKVEGIKAVLNLFLPFVVYVATYQYSVLYPSNFRNIKKVLWVSLALNFLIGIIMSLFGHSFFMRDYSGTMRLVGSMGWATFAYFLIPYTIILFDRFLYERAYIRNIGFTIFLFLSGLILLTVSRTAILGYLMILFIGYFVLTKVNSFKLIVSFVVGAVMSFAIYDKLISRSFVSESGNFATSGRLISAIYLFDQNVNSIGSFLVGAGTGTASTQVLELDEFSINSTHSYILDVLIDNGLIGLLLLILFIASITYKFYKTRHQSSRRNFVPIAAISFLVPLFLFDNSIAVFTNGVLFAFAGHYEACLDNDLPGNTYLD